MTCEGAPNEKSMTPIPEKESEMIHQIKEKFLGDMDQKIREEVVKMSDKIMNMYC